MVTMIDTILQYNPPPLGWPSRCRLRIFEVGDGGSLVVFTELGDNEGMSVTNAAGHLAALVAFDYDLDPANVTWLENYTPASYTYRDGRAETFDLVSFTWQRGRGAWLAMSPEWKRVTAEEIEIAYGVEL